ncbi:MAG: hypothetical protein KOO62_01745 [candidate division Zixibacteria bacterium]|nr:hypothetical protein [candidate division Zixibacteria bacterium]
MSRFILAGMLVLILLLTVAPQTEGGIAKSPRKYNMLNFYGGYAEPHGEYDWVGLIDVGIQNSQGEILDNVDAESVFDPTWYVGFDYGTLYNRHMLIMIGFRFTEHNAQDWIREQVARFTYRQYDIEFNANYMLFDLSRKIASPYVGAGVQAGFTSYAEEGYDDDSQLKVAVSLNFGADLKIYQAPQSRSFVTISSMNNYNLWGSKDRPQYLNLGAALRYYFR